MQFDVWVDGRLRRCRMENRRVERGRFTRNVERECVGVLDDSRRGFVKQDQDARLYWIPNNA